MPIFRLMPYLRGMRDMGIDEAGMADIEAEIAAHPTHPMIRVLKRARKARIQRPGMGKQGGGRVIYYVAIGADRSLLYDGRLSQERAGRPIDRSATPNSGGARKHQKAGKLALVLPKKAR